jgi:hypothetical protein
MSDATDLIHALAPVLEHLASEDPRGGAATATTLNETWPLGGPVLTAVRAVINAGLTEGWLTPREAGGVRFGRVAKATDATHGFSIDAVQMHGPGPGHTHPNGEFDLCFAQSGAPEFDGNAPGWTVYAPGTWHTPTVRGGEMVILYFLPGGAMRFEPRPA